MIACFPQYVLIYKQKSTKGFSILAQVLNQLACLSAITQVVLDYYFNGNNTGFWHELNMGKFFTCWSSIAGVSVFLIMHWYYEYKHKPVDEVVARFDEAMINQSNEAEDIQKERDMTIEGLSFDEEKFLLISDGQE